MILKAFIDNKKPSLLQTIFVVSVCAFMWGIGNVIIRSLLIEGVNEIFLVALRVSIIGVLLLLYLFIFNEEKYDMTLIRRASLTGLISIFFVSWSFVYALKFISSGLVTLMISSAPIFTIIWLKIFLKTEKITKLKYFAIFMGFLGISYLFITKETGLVEDGNIVFGGSLAFIGVQSISLATVFNRKYAPKYKISVWLSFQYPFVMLLSLAAFFISGVGIEILSISQAMRVLFVVISNITAFLCFTWLIQRVTALFVATIDYLVPIVGVTGGVLLLGETFNTNIFVSSVFIFLSLIITTKDEFSKQKD